jgi:hypothetical protein
MLRRVAFLLLPWAVACSPFDTVDDTDVPVDAALGPTFGRLYAAPMSLVWGWNTVQVDGTCMDLKIATHGVKVGAWQITVTVDGEIDELLFVAGAHVVLVEDKMVITPSGSPVLDAEEQVQVSVCTDPGVRLSAMTADVEFYEEPEVVEPDDDEPLPYATLLGPETTYAIEYAQDGVENGGECLRIHVINLLDEPLTDWAIELTMDEATTPTYTEGLRFYSASDDVLIVLPDADSRTIQPFDDEVGLLCLEPLAVPIETRIGTAPVP